MQNEKAASNYLNSNYYTSIGAFDNVISDPFYIKTFMLHSGGSIIGYEEGSFGILANCILVANNSDSIRGPNICLLC